MTLQQTMGRKLLC